MVNSTKNLYRVRGHIVEVSPTNPCKAIIEFRHGDNSGRAILFSDRLQSNGNTLAKGEDITKHVQIGSKIVFSCHEYHNMELDLCNWFVTLAYCLDADELQLEVLGVHKLNVIHGLINKVGTLVHVSKKQAVISYFPEEGKEERVLLLASRFYSHGKRWTPKMSFNVDDIISFDAVPLDGEDDLKCTWVCTIAWKGNKPEVYYETSLDPLPVSHYISDNKSALNNPYSMFVQGQGKIFHILSDEYGICLGALKENVWQTVLFHRSCVNLFGTNLTNENLNDVFKKGDCIRFLATPAGADCIAQWIARQISIDYAEV